MSSSSENRLLASGFVTIVCVMFTFWILAPDAPRRTASAGTVSNLVDTSTKLLLTSATGLLGTLTSK